MKLRNKVLILLLAIIVSGLCFGKPIFNVFRNTDTIANKIGCRIYELNKIKVKVDRRIDLEEIEIKSGENIVFSSNKQINRIGQAYGHTIFDIYQNDLLVAEIGHFKENNWYTNDYEFVFHKTDGKIIISYKIDGPDSNNDSFQKRYIRNKNNTLIQIEYLTESGEIYNVENI